MRQWVVLIVVVLIVVVPMTLLAAPKGQGGAGEPFSLFMHTNTYLGKSSVTYYITPTTDSSITITDILIQSDQVTVGPAGPSDVCKFFVGYWAIPPTLDSWNFENYLRPEEAYSLNMTNGFIVPIQANQTLYIMNNADGYDAHIACRIYVNGTNNTGADFTTIAPTQ